MGFRETHVSIFFFRLKTVLFILSSCFQTMAMHEAPQIQWTNITFPKELFYCLRPLFCDGIQLAVPSSGN